MADYRDHYSEIQAAGAGLVAVSVDSAHKTEALRRGLRLPFPILCDTERRVIKDWDICNPREKGGIAKPAVFIIGPDRVLRYSSVDDVAKRVPASVIIHVLTTAKAPPACRKLYIPALGDFVRALRNKGRG